jgi:multidrug efflux pump subunit AcrA (membrane-fusion protein)
VKTATLRAEVSGQVEKVLAQRGDRVRKDQIIVQLRMNDRQARLKQAETLVRQRETEYQAKQDLVGQGLLERIAEKESLSALESARAALETVAWKSGTQASGPPSTECSSIARWRSGTLWPSTTRWLCSSTPRP